MPYLDGLDSPPPPPERYLRYLRYLRCLPMPSVPRRDYQYLDRLHLKFKSTGPEYSFFNVSSTVLQRLKQ